MALAVLSIVGAVGCSSSRAERELNKALALERKGRLEESVELLKDLEVRYPDTEAARRAAKMRPLYEGLLAARARYPVRQAIDVLQQTARAIESFKGRTGSLPAGLRALVPGDIPEVPSDPWGETLQYVVRGTHYRLTSRGSDRAPGGEGEALDLFVEDGRLAPAPGWAER
jgi:Type II secretion system (T2SS), protein G